MSRLPRYLGHAPKWNGSRAVALHIFSFALGGSIGWWFRSIPQGEERTLLPLNSIPVNIKSANNLPMKQWGPVLYIKSRKLESLWPPDSVPERLDNKELAVIEENLNRMVRHSEIVRALIAQARYLNNEGQEEVDIMESCVDSMDSLEEQLSDFRKTGTQS